ncbi:putative ferredoxin-like protein YdhX precursor [Rubripirellula lacrimiformis]|uniref:Putative ferredoxin-like protein YdhX n=2 Tax=Rubripirellula lacrimiformis TaxID=1930273 RepID=A0A517NFZ4_9BACT|nr:putative ferredoxin-like protein YdhX precursor [Rubripirellula lacrimiformis]
MDASICDADVSWLRSREPFASMNASSFPRSMPLDGILRNDTRLHRCEPGEIIVREGDYGNSAFLVLAGSAAVVVQSLLPEQLGRTPEEKLSWTDALRRFLSRSRVPESRRPDQVTAGGDGIDSVGTVRQVDDRPTLFLQDFDGVLRNSGSVSLGPGEMFGEVAAMYRSPRSATVIAETEVTLLEIRWQGLKILRRDQGFADTLDRHYRQNWLKVHLSELPLLRHVPESNLVRIADATQMHSFGRMEWNADYKKTRQLPVQEQLESEPIVSAEGRVPTDLIIVRSGFGRMSQSFGASERTTAYMGKGQIFGLEEIAFNMLRPETVAPKATQQSLRAIGFLDALFIPAETFAEEILPYVRRSELPDSVAQWMDAPKTAQETDPNTVPKAGDRRGDSRGRSDRRGEQRAADQGGANPQPSPDASGQQFQQTGLLEFIVQNRVNNGRQAMVIDLHRCTRCDDCVKACAATHDGNPRFVRQGVAHEQLQFVQACMQCSDPVCMIGCPTGSIARDEETGVVRIHEPICIGCGTCASSCPYENIRMAEVADPQGRPYTDMQTGKPIRKATKCDMCQSQPTGPACVAACPHDALVRIDLTQSKPLQQWLDRRS